MRSRLISASLCIRLRGKLDRLADTDISPAAADIPAHGVIDIGIRGMRITRQQRRRRHDLSGLTVAALHDFMIEPRFLDFCARRRSTDDFNRCDSGLINAVDRCDARPRRNAIDMYRAGAAQRRAATEFRAGHAEYVAQDPEQRRITLDVDAMRG